MRHELLIHFTFDEIVNLSKTCRYVRLFIEQEKNCSSKHLENYMTGPGPMGKKYYYDRHIFNREVIKYVVA